MSTLTTIPDRFAAGTTVKYTRTLTDYSPASGWGLTVYLAGASVLNKAASASGASFAFELTAAETGGLTPGTYTWVERASKAGEVYDVASGVLTVAPNLATATAGSLQSVAEKELAAVETAIQSLLLGGISSYQIANRAVTKLDLPELLKLRAALRGEVARERGTTGLGRTHRITFTGTANE